VERSRLPTDPAQPSPILALSVAVWPSGSCAPTRATSRACLFGDILGVSWLNLGLISPCCFKALAYLALTAATNPATIDEIARPLSRGWPSRSIVCCFNSFVGPGVAISIKAVGLLLTLRLWVIPACASRFW